MLDWKRLWARITMGLVVGAPLGLFAVGIAAITRTAWVGTQGLYSSNAVRIAFPIAALLNAGAEEFVWRYALLDRLLASGLPVVAATLLQAASFAMPHWSGLPPGTLGVVASLAFGLIVGGLTIRTRSIVPAVTAHALVDLALFWYALSHGLFGGGRDPASPAPPRSGRSGHLGARRRSYGPGAFGDPPSGLGSGLAK